MRVFLFIITVFISAVSAHAPDTLWTRSLDLQSYTYADGIDRTPDGGFIVAGTTQDTGVRDVCLFKLDAAGNVVWSRAFGLASRWEKTYSVETLSNGEFVVGAYEFTGVTYTALLIRVDDEGNLVWMDSYEGQFASSVMQIPSGWIAYATSYHYDAALAKVSPDGTQLEYTVYDQGFTSGLYGMDYVPVGGVHGSEGFIACGSVGDSLSRPLVIRTDMDLNTIWSKVFTSYHEGRFYDVVTLDDGFAFSGATFSWTDNEYSSTYDQEYEQDFTIVKTDPNGVLQWEYIYESSAGTQWAYHLERTPFGCLVACGADGAAPPVEGAIALVLDLDGNLIWSECFIGHQRRFSSCVAMPSGGYCFAGTTAPGPSDRDAWVVRVDCETGMEEGEILPAITFDISPNPFSASLDISFNLPETAKVELSVYDLSGRLIETLVSGSISAGDNISVWNPAPSLSDGCYMIVLDSCGERTVRRCVKL